MQRRVVINIGYNTYLLNPRTRPEDIAAIMNAFDGAQELDGAYEKRITKPEVEVMCMLANASDIKPMEEKKDELPFEPLRDETDFNQTTGAHESTE